MGAAMNVAASCATVADDNEETIGNRLRVYETHTLPVTEYYKEQEKAPYGPGGWRDSEISSRRS